MIASPSVLALAAASLLTVSGGAYARVLVSEPALPCGWGELEGESVAEDMQLSVALRLELTNMDALEDFARSVSNPESAQYGAYMSDKQVNAFVSPLQSHVDAVTEWVEEHVRAGTGITYTMDAGATVRVNGPVHAIETMFGTHIRTVHNHATNQTTMRAESFTLPSSIMDASPTVYGLHGLPLPPRRHQHHPLAPTVNPSVIESFYNVTGVNVNRTSTQNRQAVAEFQVRGYAIQL